MKIVEIAPEDTWQIRQQVIWPNHSLEFVKLPNDVKGRHFGLKVNNRLTSIISVFYENNELQFRKFATLTSEQGKGYGSYLLNYIMKPENHFQSFKAIWCNARLNKSMYYERFGLKKTKNTYVKEGITFIIMKKKFNLSDR